MSDLKFETKSIVVPGDLLAQGLDYLPTTGTFRDGEGIYASRLGIFEVKGRFLKVINLTGPYIPQYNDNVIGIIKDFSHNGWQVDVRAPVNAFLSISDAVREYVDPDKVRISKYFNVGDVVSARVEKFSQDLFLQISMKGPGLNKLRGGYIMEITPAKVPRLIGKQGSMIKTIKDATNCIINVGQNGRVWVKSEDPANIRKAVKAIMLVEENSHTSGLTDRIKEMLGGEKETKKEEEEKGDEK